MPNHCHNRVTFYSDDSTAILKLHSIFMKGIENDDNSETCLLYTSDAADE